MIAEDDDLSMRIIRQGMSVHVCPQAELTELAPASICAFFSQVAHPHPDLHPDLHPNLASICAFFSQGHPIPYHAIPYHTIRSNPIQSHPIPYHS
jgi:hypothetical protein